MKILLHSRMKKVLEKMSRNDVEIVSNFITLSSKAESIIDILNLHNEMVKLNTNEKQLYSIRISNKLELLFEHNNNEILILDITNRDNKELIDYNYINDIDFKVIEAYLIEGWSHRKIQSEILELEAPDNGGGYEAMRILHQYGITGSFKGILNGKRLDKNLFVKYRNIKTYLENVNT